MSKLEVGLGERSYPITIEQGCLNRIGTDLSSAYPASRYCIIADDNVAELYGMRLQQEIELAGMACDLLDFPHGEAHKNIATVASLLSRTAQKRLDRKSLIIALGGGVSGDIAGFVAATYMRGIPFVQIPTSLLAQVDSSVGGKTGVDIPEGKNLVGSFYQPEAVYIDSDVLNTLPGKEYINGMAEVIKHGIIRDADYFQMLDQKFDQVMALDPGVLAELIHVSCKIKSAVVAEDEKESNTRRILNFGHTIGHAVEAASDFQILHGFAVAIGMVACARISVLKGILGNDKLAAIISMIKRYGLPTEVPEDLDRNRIKSYLLTDKKRINTKTSYILAVDIGEVIITEEVSDEEIDAVIGI
ncbi:MAG: 3-dehydroquinate synthase [Desulfobulbaceae bacterium]|nr:MAG: 3-dehydroquinate synthase [Desulfobulbaceae bacterium]